MIESVGNIQVYECQCFVTYVTKLFRQSANGLIYVKMIVFSSDMSKTPVYDMDQLSPTR